jgi:NADH-quinone oxidoreductase subunit F
MSVPSQADAFNEIVRQWERPEQAVIPLLHHCMEDKHHISDGDIERISRATGVSTSEVLGIGTFYQHFSFHPMGRHIIWVCLTTPCLFQGGSHLLERLSKELGIGLEETTPDGQFTIRPAQCLGHCAGPPCFMVDSDVHTDVSLDDLPRILDDYRNDRTVQSIYPVGKPILGETMAFGGLKSEITLDFDAYRKRGGYEAFEKVVTSMTREGVREEIRKSGLAGRGGGAFPTYRKIEGVMNHPNRPHYLACNADEGEPGTFKDRYIMERDPHSLIEGMLIAAYTIDAPLSYIYIRAEYPHAYRILEKAIKEAEEHNFLGENILGSGFSHTMRVYRGAGAYICGEETSMINSLEGKRGYPRNKPPRIADVGLWGKPSEVQNVETLANIPEIIRKGGEWYYALGNPKSPGSKLFCLSGHIANPGVYEVSLGLSLRDLIYDLGGGIPGGRSLKAILPAGSASRLLLPEHLDLSLDYPSISKVGAFLGSASVIVIDDSVCMVDLAFWIAAFSHHESCGQCTPCRDGTEDVYEILLTIMKGEGKPEYLDLIRSIGSYMREASICGLGQSAPNIPLSSIEFFEEEWRQHIVEHRCALNVCPMGPVPIVFPQRRSRGLLANVPLLNPMKP